MFTADEIARAHRIVKVATTLAPALSQALGQQPERLPSSEPAPAGPAPGQKLDPYAYNVPGGLPDPQSLKEKGWNSPEQSGFFGSLGKSVGGTLLRGPANYARSMVGMSPGRSGIRNWLGGGPRILGGKLFGFQDWVQAGRQQAANPNNFQAPYQRAEQQAQGYQKALPQYLEKNAPFFVHPLKTIHDWGMNAFGSNAQYP